MLNNSCASVNDLMHTYVAVCYVLSYVSFTTRLSSIIMYVYIYMHVCYVA